MDRCRNFRQDCVLTSSRSTLVQALPFMVSRVFKEHQKKTGKTFRNKEKMWKTRGWNGFSAELRVTRQHTEEGGETSDDSNDEIGGGSDGGASDDFQVAMFAHIAERADALVAALILIINASRAVTATRPPSAFIHVAATTSVFSLTRWTTKKNKNRCHTNHNNERNRAKRQRIVKVVFALHSPDRVRGDKWNRPKNA